MSETIDVKINISDISQQLSDARQELTSLKNEIEATPSIHQVMGEGIDKTQTTIDQLKNKIDAFNGSTGESKERMAQDLLAGVEDVRVSTNMFSKSGSFSVSLAKQMFSGLSAAAQSELNKSTAEITRMITSALGTIKSRSLAGMAREILYTPDAQRLFETKIKPGTVTSTEYEKYISALLPNIAPLHLFSEYQTARYGSYHKNDITPSPMAVLPKSFQESYKAKRFVATNLSDDEKRGILPASERALLKAEISNNDAAARAARKVEGMTKRNSDNKLMLSRNISRSQFEDYKRNLWEDWVVRSSGRSSDRIDIFDEDLSTEDSRKVYQRITGSSAGKVLNAMNVADKIIASATWDGEKDRRGYETLPKEAARALEQYEITKLSFGDILENRAPSRATISEGVNTRMQGLSGTHNQFTDKIVEMDFRGFDKNNKDHEALATLYTSGQPVNLPGLSKRYIAQNKHGTSEDDFVWRFVEEAAYNEVMQREIDWLKSEGLYSDTPGQGLSGFNYWNNFISESFDFGTRKNYRRHQDATGKPWTPGSDIEANLQNKNFGIIDVSRMEEDDVKKYADGIAWLTQGILPRGSIQGRFALGGKGTLHEQKARTLGQWAEMTGLIQPGERFIQPGPNGDVDLTDMHGMFDVSTIKNMQAYQNFNTPESLNSAFSKLVARYGISSMTTYTDSDTRAKGIGSQAAMFMKLPQSMQELQVAEYKKRWNLLDTPTGIREFIMNSGNSHLEDRLRAGEINESHPQIQYMVAAEKEAMARKALAGEQIDFSDEGLIRNQKVNKNPLTAILELHGGTREDRIEKIRDAIKKRGLEREYTDDEIAGMFGLGGNEDGAIIDFDRPEEELVSFMRSPNGFGQFVYGKNYASIAKEVFKAFGLSTEGAFLSEEDMETIGTADYDGDAIKTAYGMFAAAIKDTAIAHKALKKSQGYIRQAREVSVRPEDENERFVDSPEQRLMATEDAIAAAMSMGLTSGAGEKAAQFDLSDPQHQAMLRAAIQANDAYDLATASAKNATKVEQTPEMKMTNLLGRKWQFIPSKFSRLFNISGQDDMHVPDDDHIFTASNGLKVNLEALERLNIDRTNLPSVNQDAVVTGLRSAVSMGATSESIDQMNAVMEALDQSVGYRDLGPKSQTLLKNMRALKLQTNARLRGMMAPEEEQDLSIQVADARQEIIAKANAMSLGKSGMVKLPDGTEMKYSDYVNAAARAANIDIATNHLEQFGLTAGRLQGKYGDAASSIVQDLVPKGVVSLPASSVQSPIVVSIPNSVQEPIHENKVPEKKSDTQQHVSQDDTHPEEKPAPSVNAAPAPASNKETWQYKAPEHPMFDYLQALREDMEQSGLSETDAAERFVKWYNESVPVSDDPIEMTQESALKTIQNFIKTGKQPGYIRGDNDLSGDGSSLVASDLEKLRTIEGSRALYEDLNTSIRKTASSWYRMGIKEEDPEAAFYNTALREINNAEFRYDNAMKHGDPKTIGPGTAAGMDLANNLNWMRSSFFDATRAHFSSSGENVFESLRRSVAGVGDEVDRQLLQLNNWSESVATLEKQLTAFKNARKERAAESRIDKEDDDKTIAEQERRISEAKLLFKQGQEHLLKSNNNAFVSQYDSLYESMTGKLATPEEKIKRIVESYRDKIAKEILNIEDKHAKQQLSDEDYESRIADFRSLQEYAGSTLEARLLEQNQAQKRRRIEVSNKRVENLRTQGRKLKRNAWGHRGSGLLSRSMYEWENGKDQYDNRIAALKSAMELEEKTLSSATEGSDEYKTASQNLDKLKSQLEQTETAAARFSGGMGKVAVTMTNIGDAVGRVASQFGRQMFHTALQEAKRFVREYDAAMTEIQMVTMKSDTEIAQLGSNLVQTAIDMKVSIPEVTSAATELYRQGIDDEEVATRMEDVLKFSKVANIKSTEASKIITTALANGLVDSSGEAMDALVAQGDAAATSAEEISKGMQKSAASAKQAGVSYDQLVTMLTIITSKTQLGGNQAGTALQTLMYRLYRVNEGEDFYDENGNRVAANKATKALDQLGVSVYDENGNARGAFDIMVDVAKNWDSADNISQEMVLNALGAGRQRSNIATLIQGLAEDEGALMEKYMNLASGSEGITDEKYLSYLNSLQASLDAVKSSFDQLIASFAVSDTASGVLNFIAEFIQGLAAAEEASGALTTGIKTIVAALAVLAVASAAIKLVTGGIAAVADMAVGIGALVVLGGLWGVSSYGNNVKRTTAPSASNIGATMKERTSEYDDYREVISDSEKLNEKYKAGKITDLEIDKLQSNLNTQTSKFGLASVDLSNVATNAESVAQTLAAANRLQQAEFADQLKGNVAQAKTAVAEEAIANIRSSNQFNQFFATAMGGTLLEDGKFNYGNRDRHAKQTPESIKAIKGYGDLAAPEQDLSAAFNETYQDETGFNWGKANSVAIQQYYTSRMLDEMLSDYVSTGAKSSDKIITAAGLDHYSYERLHQLLTSYSYEDLMKTDGERWAGELHAGDEGVNAEAVFKEKQAQAVAALWQYWNNAYSSGDLKFEDMSKKTIDGILTNHVRPVVAGMVNSEQLDYVMAQLINNVYDGLDLNTANGEIVSSRINKELEVLKDMRLREGKYAGTETTIESDYLDESYQPKWNIYNKDGQIVRENVSQVDLDKFKAQKLQAKQAAPVSTELVDMSEWLKNNPQYEWDKDQKDWDIWQYADSNGNVHFGTFAEMEALQSSDRESKETARDARIDVAAKNVDEAGKAQHAYELIANKRNTISGFQEDAPNVASYAELRSLALGLPEEYHAAVAKQINESEPAGTPSASNQEQLAFQYVSSQFTVDKLREMEKAGQEIDKYVSKDWFGFGKINGFADGISYLDFIKQFDPEAYDQIQKLDQIGHLPDQWVQDRYPLLPAEYKPVQFDFLEEELERLNALYADNNPKTEKAFVDANAELTSAQAEVIAVNDIVMQPIDYNSLEEWQAGYDTEYNNQITAIKKANLDALDKNFWNTDGSGSGFVYREALQIQESDAEAVDYLGDALSSGLSAEQTDEVVLKNQVDDFARYLAINGVFGDESVDMVKQTDLLTSSRYGDLKTIMTSGIGLAEIIDGVFQKNDKGEYIMQDGKRVLVDDTAWLQTAGRNFYEKLMGASGSYSDITSASKLRRSQVIKNIKGSYDAGYSLSDNDVSILSSIYGDSLVAKYQNAALNLWDTTYDAKQLNDDGTFKVDEDGSYSNQSASIQAWINEQNKQNEQIKQRNAIRKNVAGGTYSGDVESWMTEPLEDIKEFTWSEYQKAALERNAEIRGSANIFTEEEEAFMKILDQNALYGIDRLTSQQALQGAENILGYISRGEYSNYLRNDATMVDTYLSQFSNFGNYASMAHVLEDAKVSDGADGFYTMNDILSLAEGSTGYEAVAKAFEEAGISMKDAVKTAEDFNDEIATAKKKYGDFTGEVLSNSKAWKGNKREISNAFKELNSKLADIGNNQYYRTQFKNGARDKKTLEAIGAMIGISGLDEKYVEEHSEYVESLLETAYQSDLEAANVLADSIDEIINLQDFSVDQSNISVDASGNLDMSGVMAALAADQSEYAQNVYSMIQAFAAIGGSVQLVREGSGENMVFKTVVSLGDGVKPRGGGGGGGGKKSVTEKLLEEQEHEVKLREHKIKMIQYEETRYENANEQSNQAIMIQHEIKEEERLIELKKEHLNELKKQLAATKKYSKEWYTCAEAILTTEEAIAELNNTIDKNKQKIEDLEQQVLKLHTDLESTVKEEIETRIQAERDMLKGTVSMQDVILEAIRDRYRKEWELMQEDIDKKRKALEEEIAMIDERLQRRKDAEDEASKHEELAELERQLALVSMDSTRTKDQAEIRERIEELQRELAWDAADDEAQFQKDMLQDEIDAYDQYEEDYQEYLDDLLEDANNFSVEVNEVLQMSQEDLLQWLSDNVEEFRLSLEASQEQLTQNWTDTFKQMKGIVDTFWEEIIATLSSKESFMEYMKQSQTYQQASDDEKAQMEYTWGNMYDDWISAKKESDEAKNYDHNDAGDESNGKTANNTVTYKSYYGGLDSSGKWVTGGPYSTADAARSAANRKGLSSIKISSGGAPSAPTYKIVSSDGTVLDNTEYKDKNAAQQVKGSKIQQWGSSGNTTEIEKWQSSRIEAYSSGGYVDYTGLAMVHGSSSRPEAFLSAEDTALVRAMLDSWQFVLNRPVINNVDSALSKNGSGVSFGDLTIEINEASLADDADIEAVARRVGEAFTKELSQSGLRTVSYNF